LTKSIPPRRIREAPFHSTHEWYSVFNLHPVGHSATLEEFKANILPILRIIEEEVRENNSVRSLTGYDVISATDDSDDSLVWRVNDLSGTLVWVQVSKEEIKPLPKNRLGNFSKARICRFAKIAQPQEEEEEEETIDYNDVDYPMGRRLQAMLQKHYLVDPDRGIIKKRAHKSRGKATWVRQVEIARQCWTTEPNSNRLNIIRGFVRPHAAVERVSAAQAIVAYARGYVPTSVRYKDSERPQRAGRLRITNMTPMVADSLRLRAKVILGQDYVEGRVLDGAFKTYKQLYYRARYDNLIPCEDFGELEPSLNKILYEGDRLVRITAQRGNFERGDLLIARTGGLVHFSSEGKMVVRK